MAKIYENIIELESISYFDDEDKMIQKPTDEEHAYHEGWQDYNSGKEKSSYFLSSIFSKSYLDGWKTAETVDRN